MDRISIVGGCGYVGIPLGLAFTSKGVGVSLVDVPLKAVDAINAGRLPFKEEGAEELLAAHVGVNLHASSNMSTASPRPRTSSTRGRLCGGGGRYRRSFRFATTRENLRFSWDAIVPIPKPSALSFGFHGENALSVFMQKERSG